MATILEFRRRIPIVYLSSNASDLAAIKEAEGEAALSTTAKVFVEDLNQWKLFRKLLRQDRRGIISLEFIIFRPGTSEVKKELLRLASRNQGLT